MMKWDQSSAPRILIIDDNRSIHRDFELILVDGLHNADLEADEERLYGSAQHSRPAPLRPVYSLEHALSGQEGVEKVRQSLEQERPYQVAFVDIRMPGMDGVETIERIWRADPRIQVVICTAYADYSSDDLGRRLGCTDKLLVLKKPFDNIEVTLLASTLAEKWRLARQAALKLEQMELLVAQRTQRLLALQHHASLPLPEPEPPAQRPDPAAPQPGKGTTASGEPGPEPPLILLVEDDAEFGSTISQGLGTEYRVVEVNDGREGLDQAQETVPDLVITETRMPRLDGIELCRRLKADELASHIPVIVLAAPGLEDAQIKALEAGADDYLPRPLSLTLLKARVDNLLRSHHKPAERSAAEVTFHPRDMAANQVDAHFLQRTIETIEKHLADFEFDVDELARKLAVSRRQLFRKLRAVTGRTPNAFIRTLRLNRAAQLLSESQMTVTEITYAVGFSDLKHFRTVFRDQFGVLPAEYTRQQAETRGKPAPVT